MFPIGRRLFPAFRICLRFLRSGGWASLFRDHHRVAIEFFCSFRGPFSFYFVLVPAPFVLFGCFVFCDRRSLFADGPRVFALRTSGGCWRKRVKFYGVLFWAISFSWARFAFSSSASFFAPFATTSLNFSAARSIFLAHEPQFLQGLVVSASRA